MNQQHCNIYPFLKAVRGCWHNALFIKCEHTVCPHGQSPPCGGFLMAVDADGSHVAHESIEPEECRAVLGKQTFETVYGLYIEWHTISSTDCPLLELCQTSHQCRCL